MTRDPDAAAAKHRLRRELRTLRTLAGLSGRALAVLMETSQTRISRIEAGHGALSEEEVRRWAHHTRASETKLARLLSLNHRAHTNAIDGGVSSLRTLEARAGTVRVFEPASVPELLRTGPYARQLLQS